MTQPLKNILEAALMAAGNALSLERMQSLFEEDEIPDPQQIRDALEELKNDLSGRGIELTEVASGYRFQVSTDVAPWVARLWEERPQRYSRALLETLALIAYRQPITRGDIEDVRGVVVSSTIMKTLLEREWVRVVGHRDVPGRPAMYATTKEFLDYFGLKSLEELPTLMQIRELDDANRKLELGEDAEARKEPDKEYNFQSDEDVAQRGADVLSETEDDLASAAAMLERVEKNLFHRDEDEEGDETEDGKKPARSIGDLLERLEKNAQAEQKGSEVDDELSVTVADDSDAESENGDDELTEESDSEESLTPDEHTDQESDADSSESLLSEPAPEDDNTQPGENDDSLKAAPSVFGDLEDTEEFPSHGTHDNNQSSGAASSEDDDAETGEEERT